MLLHAVQWKCPVVLYGICTCEAVEKVVVQVVKDDVGEEEEAVRGIAAAGGVCPDLRSHRICSGKVEKCAIYFLFQKKELKIYFLILFNNILIILYYY